MTAREPSAVEVIAEVLGEHRPSISPRVVMDCECGWMADKRRIGHHDEHRADSILAALKAAGFVVATRDEIRAMTPSEQAELIGGKVRLLRAWGYEETDAECVVGPWVEVHP